MTAETTRVELAERSYDITIGTGCFDGLGAAQLAWWQSKFGGDKNPRALLVTDENVARFHAGPAAESLIAAGWSVATIAVPAGEESKCLTQLATLYDRLVAMPADRQTVVVAVGGGVVGDLAGFAAASFNRGIPFVQVPTTLLAQVDSSVGGKTGINHAQGKNLIGAFHQPLGVFIDTQTLATLPDREYRAGLAEVLKYGVIMDEPFFVWLEENVAAINDRDASAMRYIVRRSCELKAIVVAEDERETSGRRAILNYGHTFAHAFEALCQYGTLLHGEAVAIGMKYAARLAQRVGRVDEAFVERQTKLIAALKLPTELPESCQFSSMDVLGRMKLDKKTVGDRLRFILPTRIGYVEVVKDIDEATVLADLQDEMQMRS